MTSIITSPTTLGDLSGTYVLDPAHTRIGFVARHAMVTKVRGQFNEFEGSAVVDADDFSQVDSRSSPSRPPASTPATSSATATCAATTSSPSRSTRRSPSSPPASRQTGETSLELTGDLTIKGVTNSITVPFEFEGAATDPFGNLRVGFEGSVVDQPQGLRRQLERRARGRRRAGQREGHPRVRGLGDQEQLTPATYTTGPAMITGRRSSDRRPVASADRSSDRVVEDCKELCAGRQVRSPGGRACTGCRGCLPVHP